MGPAALRAIRSWVRLDRALRAFDAEVRRGFGVSGLQLALLRILAERSPMRLAELRRSLVLHPATVGQAVDALVEAGLCERARDREDGRAWVLSVTPAGRDLIARAPLAGPVRLRSARVSRSRLDRLATALEDAIDLFGLARWAPPLPATADPRERRRRET